MEALYFEARGEEIMGQFAVAEVILNRVDSSKFPNTICGVVDQGSGRRNACQFSYNCDGVHENMPKNANYERASRIAETMINGGVRQLVGGATYYQKQYNCFSKAKVKRTNPQGGRGREKKQAKQFVCFNFQTA